MLYGLLVTFFVILSIFMILIILIQKGKGMGVMQFGAGSQMLFGGSGGQDLFQKITWTCGALFMLGSLILALMKSGSMQQSRYLVSPKAATNKTQPASPQALQAEETAALPEE